MIKPDYRFVGIIIKGIKRIGYWIALGVGAVFLVIFVGGVGLGVYWKIKCPECFED